MSDQPGPGWTPPPQRRSNRLPLILGIIAVVIVVVGVIGALALLGSVIPELGGGTAMQDVEVGQCFDGARARPSAPPK